VWRTCEKSATAESTGIVVPENSPFHISGHTLTSLKSCPLFALSNCNAKYAPMPLHHRDSRFLPQKHAQTCWCWQTLSAHIVDDLLFSNSETGDNCRTVPPKMPIAINLRGKNASRGVRSRIVEVFLSACEHQFPGPSPSFPGVRQNVQALPQSNIAPSPGY